MKMSQEIQEKELLSLFFLYFTRTCPRLPVPAHTRVCVWWGEKEERSHFRPRRMPPGRPRSRTFAPCGVLFPMLDKYATVARCPTRANVAYHPAFPQVVGTTKNRAGVLASGNSRHSKYSLFLLSDFFSGGCHDQ